MKKIKKIFNYILIKFKSKKVVLGNSNSINQNKILFQNVEFINSQIGDYSYVARNSIIHNTSIGKFCSIGPNVVVGYGDHPLHFISTSPVFYCSTTDFDLKPKENLFFGHTKVEIGNDVWIGANVFIKNGLKIGNGSVIGAGSVILKDIEPYSIVVGVPGKMKSKRFSDEIVLKLQELQWWDWSIATIKENFELFTSDIIIHNIDLLFEIKKKTK